jgi:outer membrane protein TolC
LALLGALASLPAAAAPGEGPDPTGTTAEREPPASIATRADAPDVAPVELSRLSLAPGGITADRVAELAAESSVEIEARRAELAAAAARVDALRVRWAPSLVGEASYTRLSDLDNRLGDGLLVGAQNPGGLVVGACPDGTAGCVVDGAGAPVGAVAVDIRPVLDNFSLRATLGLPLSDWAFVLPPAIAAARRGERAARLQELGERATIEASARAAYYDWLRALAQETAVEASLARSEAQLREVSAAARAGAAPPVDVLRLEAAVAGIEAELARAVAVREVADRNLRVITQRTDLRLQPGEDLLAEPALAEPAASLDAWVDRARRDRAELAALTAAMEARGDEARAARGEYVPKLAAFAEATEANPNPRVFPPDDRWVGTWAAGASLRYELGTALQVRPRVRELEASARSVAAERERVARGVELQVTQAYAQRSAAQRAVRATERGRVAATEATRVVGLRYGVGQATALDLIEAESARVDAELQHVLARIDVREADMRLRYAAGAPMALAAGPPRVAPR